MYKLFNEFADRYDLHTPPGHYRHDHAFVIAEALRVEPTHCRLLDIGCGTGVFLEAACAAGIDGYGLDASDRMIDCARDRLPGERLRVERMQELTDQDAYDVVCALSWTIHYCETEAELDDVVARCRTALRTGGLLVLQVADDRQMTGAVKVDREPGPSGEPDDTLLIHRFRPRQRRNAHGVRGLRLRQLCGRRTPLRATPTEFRQPVRGHRRPTTRRLPRGSCHQRGVAVTVRYRRQGGKLNACSAAGRAAVTPLPRRDRDRDNVVEVTAVCAAGRRPCAPPPRRQPPQSFSLRSLQVAHSAKWVIMSSRPSE